MTSAQVVETSVNVTNNSPSRDYSHPDDETTQTIIFLLLFIYRLGIFFLRVVVYGFQSFCEWFFTVVSPDGRYFISPLRINGRALESIFSVLKHTTGGNLSIAYCPALGRLISRKNLTLNKNSANQDRTLNLDGRSLISEACTINLAVTASNIS